MSESAIFRTRDPLPDIKPLGEGTGHTEANTSNEPKTSTLFVTYEADAGHPYIAEYFDIKNVYSDPSFSKEVKNIDSFLKDKVSSKQLDDKVDSIKSYLREAEKKAGVDKTETNATKLVKINAFINMQREIAEAKRQMDKVYGN